MQPIHIYIFDKNIEQICRLTIYASQRWSYPFPFGNSYHMPVLLLVCHRFHFSFVFAWPLIGLVWSSLQAVVFVPHARYLNVAYTFVRLRCVESVFFFMFFPRLAIFACRMEWPTFFFYCFTEIQNKYIAQLKMMALRTPCVRLGANIVNNAL